MFEVVPLKRISNMLRRLKRMMVVLSLYVSQRVHESPYLSSVELRCEVFRL